MSITNGVTLAPLQVQIQADTKPFSKGLNDAAEEGQAQAKKISDQFKGITKVGENLTKVGSSLTKYVSVPLAGIGVASGKMAMDFESDFAKVSTLLDSGTVDYSKYKKDIIKGSNDMKTAVGDYSDAVYQSISAGVDQSKAIGFTNESIKLAKGGFTSASNAVDILTSVINAYSMKASDATSISDKLITTQNVGKTTVDELSSSMGKVIPSANAYGVGIDDVCTALAQLTKNGIATAEATTYYNSMLNELGKSGTTADKTLRELSGKGFKQLMDEGKPLTEILGMLKKKAEESGLSLSDMFGSAEGAKAALTIMKSDGTEYNQILGQMKNSAGATEEAFKKIDATPAEKLSGAINKLKNSAIEFGGAFAPIIGKVSDKISGLADKFSGLNEEQQDSILKWGTIAIVSGPVLKTLGTGITTFTKLKGAMGGVSKVLGIFGKGATEMATVAETAAGATTGLAGAASGASGALSILSGAALPVAGVIAGVGGAIYTMHEYTDMMNQSVTTSREEMSFMERTLADLTGQTTYTTKELEEMGLVQKKLSDNLSEDFKTAVQDSTRDIQDFGLRLHEINMDGVVTDEESTELSQRVTKACDGAIEAISSKQQQIQDTLGNAYNVDGVLDDNEAKILEYYSNQGEKEKKEVEAKQAAVNELLRKVREEGYVLTADDEAMIRQYYEEVARITLEAQSSNNYEYEYAKNEFRQRALTLDADGAAELLQQRKQELDEQLLQTNAHYQTLIDMTMEGYDGMDAATRAAADAEKTRLTEEWNAKKELIQGQYNEDYQYCVDHNENLLNVINKYTAEKMSHEDQSYNKSFEAAKAHYADMDNITADGCYRLWNNEEKCWNDVVVKVDESSGDIVSFCELVRGAHGYTAQTVYGYSQDMAKSLGSISSSAAQNMSVVDGIFQNTAQVTVSSTGIMNNALNGTETQLEDVTSAGDGLKQGIININNTPVKVTWNDKNGTIRNADEIKNAIAGIKSKSVTVSVYGQMDSTARAAFYNMHSSPSYDGNNYNGLSYVPKDGFTARLHKGERVLTAEENRNYNTNNTSSDTTINFNGNYGFNSRDDIDYFMNQAALRLRGDRG